MLSYLPPSPRSLSQPQELTLKTFLSATLMAPKVMASTSTITASCTKLTFPKTAPAEISSGKVLMVALWMLRNGLGREVGSGGRGKGRGRRKGVWGRERETEEEYTLIRPRPQKGYCAQAGLSCPPGRHVWSEFSLPTPMVQGGLESLSLSYKGHCDSK